MQTFLRASFPDTALNSALLESVTGLWLAWHLEARGWHFLPRQSFHRIEAQLWGVPRPDIEACRTQIARRAAREVPDSTVVLANSDALTVTSPWREVTQPSALARVVAGLGHRRKQRWSERLPPTAGLPSLPFWLAHPILAHLDNQLNHSNSPRFVHTCSSAHKFVCQRTARSHGLRGNACIDAPRRPSTVMEPLSQPARRAS